MKIVCRGYIWKQASFTTKYMFFMLSILILIVGAVSFVSVSRIDKSYTTISHIEQKTQVVNGTNQWVNDRQVTPLVSSLTLPNTQHITVSPLFTTYYLTHGAVNNLGNPLTSAFPVAQGWLQFFEAGALFLPVSHQVSVSQYTDNVLSTLINASPKNVAVGVVRLNLLQALLTTGSLASIGGEGSPLTYVDLRAATQPGHMIPAQTMYQYTALNTYIKTTDSQETFVQGGTRAGKDVGHIIAQPFWNYINRPDVAPDGWQEDIGVPLTEALPFTTIQNGSIHHLLVQVFSYGGLLFDQDATSELPTVSRLNIGIDYLRTFGLPDVKVAAGQAVWSQGEDALLYQPGTGHEIAHVGQNFPLVLQGDSIWSGGTLWYNVQWTVLQNTHTGWIQADAVTFTSPPVANESQASFDVLSPDLNAYLNTIGPDASVVLYDVTHQTYYTYNSSTQFLVASSMKVPIMLTFLHMVEQQGREPDDDEMNLLTTMIENSNNDSASILYDTDGDASGISSYMQKIGITGLSPDDDSWGYSLITPQAMVDMLTLLYQGKILNPSHRALALNLMENVESDQQVGVGDTAPSGATVAMKDGWVSGSDNLWAMNSSGIVVTGNETYILAVYTQEQVTLDDGKAIAHHVCSAVASLLGS